MGWKTQTFILLAVTGVVLNTYGMEDEKEIAPQAAEQAVEKLQPKPLPKPEYTQEETLVLINACGASYKGYAGGYDADICYLARQAVNEAEQLHPEFYGKIEACDHLITSMRLEGKPYGLFTDRVGGPVPASQITACGEAVNQEPDQITGGNDD